MKKVHQNRRSAKRKIVESSWAKERRRYCICGSSTIFDTRHILPAVCMFEMLRE